MFTNPIDTKTMKKLWQKAKWQISIGIVALGGAISAYFYSTKDSGKKPESGVVINNDTVAQFGTGDSIKLDTLKK